MRFIRYVILLTAGLLIGGAAGPLPAQRWEAARGVVQRTQDDLQRLREQGTRNQKERERIDNARKHLSDFDRNLTRGKFEKGRLDSAIDDLKNVVEKNTLDARSRDALAADLEDLRSVRETRGR